MLVKMMTALSMTMTNAPGANENNKEESMLLVHQLSYDVLVDESEAAVNDGTWTRKDGNDSPDSSAKNGLKLMYQPMQIPVPVF